MVAFVLPVFSLDLKETHIPPSSKQRSRPTHSKRLAQDHREDPWQEHVELTSADYSLLEFSRGLRFHLRTSKKCCFHSVLHTRSCSHCWQIAGCVRRSNSPCAFIILLRLQSPLEPTVLSSRNTSMCANTPYGVGGTGQMGFVFAVDLKCIGKSQCFTWESLVCKEERVFLFQLGHEKHSHLAVF